MLMCEDINKNCVDFKPNFDESCTEPVTLPSKFPFLLCGNNSGIAVGMGSDIVSHNFTEVSEAIKYYMEHKDCSIADLMQFIKGPDFPTGGKIINGEELLDIYTRGQGSVKVHAHYDISKKGNKTLITFHDLPYNVDIDDGVKKPLKKLVLEDGYEVFEDIAVSKVGEHNFDITITLGKDANIAQCLEILFKKTKLASSIKINQNFIVNGEPRVLNLKQMIEYWVNYRSKCISRIASTDYAKTNHKLTITIGLQKCMSNIDRVIEIVRFDATPRNTLMREFELSGEQADAVLDIKLARLSRLEIEKLNNEEKELEETLAKIKEIIDNESVRYDIIKKDLAEIKKVLGKDERITEIEYARPMITADKPVVKQEYRVYSDGIHADLNGTIDTNLVEVVFAYSPADIMTFSKEGTMHQLINYAENGAFVKDENKDKLVAVTRNGQIKVSLMSDYKFGNEEKVMKLKDDDELIMVDCCNDNDYVMIFNGENILKLAVKDLVVASKLTVGVKCGFDKVVNACVATDKDLLLFVSTDWKGKYTSVKDFSVDNRGNKGQSVADNTMMMRKFDELRESIYCICKTGKPVVVARDKLSIKGRTAQGANITTRVITKII